LGSAALAAGLEKDLLGERDVPDDALYGIQTMRALEELSDYGDRPS
jgi:aspartate ammonia-lyase